MLKGHLVCNATLAQLADRYGITDLLVAAPSALYVTRAQQKTRGSLFESWIAGVFFSSLNGHAWSTVDAHIEENNTSSTSTRHNPSLEVVPPLHHEEQVSTGEDDTTSDDDDDTSDADAALVGLKLLNLQEDPSTEQSSSLVHQTASTTVIIPKTQGEAYEHINSWLRPLLTPIAHWALECMRVEKARLDELDQPAAPRSDVPEGWIKDDDIAAGAKGALHVYTANKFGREPVYTTVRAGPGIWKTRCVVRDKTGKEWCVPLG